MALDPDQVAAYLARLGIDHAPSPDADGLRRLQAAHLRRIPFENLDIHLGIPITLEVDRLVDKIVTRQRGGFCYELNGAFAALLSTLGFSVLLHEARVHDGGVLGIPFDHLCLQVQLDEPYLVDVGFGACFDEPLRLLPGVQQHDPAGVFEIVDSGDGLDLLQDSSPQYRFFPAPRRLADFVDACSFHQTSPESHFTRNTVCSIRTDDGRVTIRGTELLETRGAERTERLLAPDELVDAYRRYFGVALDGPIGS